MNPDSTSEWTEAGAWDALAARDPRFDGLFFVGVSSTGIYCRPVCPARTPRRANCAFFPSAAAAEARGFRPCLRCRPELAPGLAPIDRRARLAREFLGRLDDHLAEDATGLEQLAAALGLSGRQLRRVTREELGASPIGLLQTRRLHLAKQLLTDTALPVIDIAFASGFGSLRRFNDAFLRHYRLPPSRFRRELQSAPGARAAAAHPRVLLGYRPPLAWDALLDFLRARAIDGVERVGASNYARTVRLGDQRGWLRVRPASRRDSLELEFAAELLPVLPRLLRRVRQLFDLDARPEAIAATLGLDPLLAGSVARQPGLRVPGGLNGFELAWRAVLGQQVSVRAATTLARRLAAALGEPVETPWPGLNRLTPTATRMARTPVADLTALGIPTRRAETLRELARGVRVGRVSLEPGGDPAAFAPALQQVPGIGPWTAQYLLLRAGRWPDAWPKEDLVLRQRLGGLTPLQADRRAEAWRPWRGYALMHLWAQP